MAMSKAPRRLPIGAEAGPEGVHIRVWAPRRRRVEVVVRGRPEARLEREDGGYFSGLVPDAGPGARYRFRLGGEDRLLADPASRRQPEGPDGPSEVVDPEAFAWTDRGWKGIGLPGLVIQEVHVGTFTPEGTWEAAAAQLPALADVGINAVELMPVAEMPGRFGWGYDGVGLFAPFHRYGPPDAMRAFVDEAHRLGIGVILDVVFNHLGPQGSVLTQFAEAYHSPGKATEWGAAMNFDGPDGGPVREFFLACTEHWIREYHLDGLRIDATQEFHDDSRPHILAEIAETVRRVAGEAGRSALVIGENEPQQADLIRPADRGGLGLDALWNDDFHHVGLIFANGHREAYYGDYGGTPQEFVSLLKRGWLYQGQFNARQGKPRGSPAAGLTPPQFINFLQNHDQVANSLRGRRLHQEADPGTTRALTAVLLLAPGTPMLFQGQEYAAHAPFVYFGDLAGELAETMHQGRREQLKEFESLGLPGTRGLVPHPSEPGVFERCRLDPGERDRNAEAYALHKDLLALRRDDPVFRAQGAGGLDGAVLGPRAFVARWGDPEGLGRDRLLAVNLGDEMVYAPVAEPLLAPSEGRAWRVAWSSEDVRYGGRGTPPPVRPEGWRLPARAAIALAPDGPDPDPEPDESESPDAE
jgi:maltooligosyltrehalose trehalohydrolase